MRDKTPGTRRVKARVKAKLHVLCTQAGEEDKNKCTTNDISEDGIQIVSHSPLDLKKSVSLEVEIPHPRSLVKAIGEIRWHKELEDKDLGTTKYIYGLKFEKIDPAAQDSIFSYVYMRIKSSSGLK